MTLNREILEFVNGQLCDAAGTAPVDDSTPLIEKGIIDSMGLMQLVGFLEERLAMRIPDREVTPANFATVVSIQQLLDRLRASRAE